MSSRAIAMGIGSKSTPHFYFYDIDSLISEIELVKHAPNALIYKTKNGAHIISNKQLDLIALNNYIDKKCPNNAVRIYPSTDYFLIQRASHLCIRVAGIYQAIFGFQVVQHPIICDHAPLRFGSYIITKEDKT